jgi:hypothetical protein
LSVKETEGGKIEITPNYNDESSGTFYFNYDGSYPFPEIPFDFYFADLDRDPAGRLRAWLSPQGQTGVTEYCSVNLIPTDTGIPTQFYVKAYGDNLNASQTGVFPTSIYYTAPQSYQDPPDTNYPNRNTTNYPVYEFIFYGYDNFLLQVNRCGTIQIISDNDDSPRTRKQEPGKEMYLIGGIIDGPIPYPIENYKDYDPGNSETNVGTLIYGKAHSQTVERSVSKSFSIGMEDEVKTTEGVGLDFKLALNTGWSSNTGDSTETETLHVLSQEAKINWEPDPKNPGEKIITPDTTGIIQVIDCETILSAYNYLDNFGESVISTQPSSGEGSKVATVLKRLPTTGTSLSFNPFDVTPGDLISYTPEQINLKMGSNGFNYAKFLPADLHLDPDNYFGEIICQNALPLTPNAVYLECTWQSNGSVTTETVTSKSSYRENSWFSDGSIYAGISGGGGFDVFGLGEKAEFSSMYGIEFSRDNSFSTETENEWSIELSDGWGPKAISSGELVTSYTFRIYFLPVPTDPSPIPKTYWTDELLRFSARDGETKDIDSIDPGSGCWKIVYVVTKIETNEENSPNNYNYALNKNLDMPSYYPFPPDSK